MTCRFGSRLKIPHISRHIFFSWERASGVHHSRSFQRQVSKRHSPCADTIDKSKTCKARRCQSSMSSLDNQTTIINTIADLAFTPMPCSRHTLCIDQWGCKQLGTRVKQFADTLSFQDRCVTAICSFCYCISLYCCIFWCALKLGCFGRTPRFIRTHFLLHPLNSGQLPRKKARDSARLEASSQRMFSMWFRRFRSREDRSTVRFWFLRLIPCRLLQAGNDFNPTRRLLTLLAAEEGFGNLDLKWCQYVF